MLDLWVVDLLDEIPLVVVLLGKVVVLMVVLLVVVLVVLMVVLLVVFLVVLLVVSLVVEGIVTILNGLVMVPGVVEGFGALVHSP